MNKVEFKRTQKNQLQEAEPVRLFVQDVLDFSSQYGKEGSNSYTVANIRSRPHYYPKYGDFLDSCVLRTYGPWWSTSASNIQVPISNQPLFISKDFIVESVIIYETYHPGAVVAIFAFDYFKQKWINLWSIFNQREYKSNKEAIRRALPQKASRKFEPNLTRRDVFSDKLRIEFEHSRHDYYCELDAIEIVGVSYDAPLTKIVASNLKKTADFFEKIGSLCLMDSVNEEAPRRNSETLDSMSLSQIRRRSSFQQQQFSSTRRNSLASFSNPTASITTCSNIVDLPYEILCIILNYLDLRTVFKLRSTCKTFYEICSYEYLFNKIDLQPYWHLIDDEFISLLADLSRKITMMNLSWVKLGYDQPIEQLFETSCKDLTMLKLDSCQFMDGKKLKLLADNCPMLTHLSLHSCTNISSEQDEVKDGFKELKNLKNLQSLNLYRTLCDQNSIVEILNACTEIKNLNLGSCVKINNFDQVAQVVSEKQPGIKSLDFWRAYSLSNAGVLKIGTRCADLEELDIGWWLLKTCKNLKMLDLSFCGQVDQHLYKSWCEIYRHCSIKKSFQSDI